MSKIICECCQIRPATTKDFRFIDSINVSGKVLVCDTCRNLNDVDFANKYQSPKAIAWNVDIDLHYTQTVECETKEQAIDIVKESFLQDYNLDLTDNEITKIQEVK